MCLKFYSFQLWSWPDTGHQPIEKEENLLATMKGLLWDSEATHAVRRQIRQHARRIFENYEKVRE